MERSYHSSSFQNGIRPTGGVGTKWILVGYGIIVTFLWIQQLMMSVSYSRATTAEEHEHNPELTTAIQENYINLIVNCETLQVDENDSGRWAVARASSPFFPMNVHNPQEDKYVSGDIVAAGCFECGVLRSLLNALRKTAPNTFLLDIGANVGMYSLSAASAKRDAVAFEPFRRNYQRICKTILRNPDFQSRIQLIRAAATDQEQWMQILRTNTTNKGNVGVAPIHNNGHDADEANTPSSTTTASRRNAYQEGSSYVQSILDSITSSMRAAVAPHREQSLHRFLRAEADTTNNGSEAEGRDKDTQSTTGGLDATQEGLTHVRGIRLDDIAHLLPQNRPVVIKVDVEGSECQALAGGMRYLSNVTIEYAAIEWSPERLQECQEREAIFGLFQQNGLKPFLHTGPGWQELDPSTWTMWKRPGAPSDTVLFDMAWSKSLPTPAAS